jgi:hypothetical protein
VTIFDPDSDDTSDADWLALVSQASAGGAHHFTENQLYCRYARGRVQVTRYISPRGKLGLVMIALGLGLWMYALKADWGLTLVLAIACTLGGVAQVGTGVVTRRDPIARARFTLCLEKWLSAAALPKLLQSPALGRAGLELAPRRVACVLIVEHDILVDLLVKNGAHEALSALVISESGYPERLALEAQRLLDERSDLKVILLHDATQHGVQLKSRLRASAALPLAERELTDPGLFAAEVGQVEELAAAFPASHFTEVPVDALSHETLLAGLVGVTRGARLLSAGIFDEIDGSGSGSERAA